MKSTVKPDLDKLLRRTPHGVRGLKLSESFGVDMGAGRTPHGVRGLKSATPIQRVAVHASHPSRGAWIEIIAVMSVLFVTACRTPHGVRGLKYRWAALARKIC